MPKESAIALMQALMMLRSNKVRWTADPAAEKKEHALHSGWNIRLSITKFKRLVKRELLPAAREEFDS